MQLYSTLCFTSSCAAVQAAGLHARGAAKARQRSQMSRAPEQQVQLADLNQNAQLPQPSSAPALNTDAPARSGNRLVDNTDVDGALGSNQEFEGQGEGTATVGDPSHASQAPAPAAPSSSSLPQTNDVMISLVSISQPLMTMMQRLVRNPGRLDEQTLTHLQQMFNTINPHWQAVQEIAQPSSTATPPVAQTLGKQPNKQADNGGSAQQHEAAKPPGQTAAMGQRDLPEGEDAAASEQAVDEVAERPAGPQGPAAADHWLGQAATTSIQDPAPGEHATTAAGL